MDGHVVHALPRLVLDHLQQVLGRHLLHALAFADGLVDGDGAHRHGAGADDRLADGVDVAAGAEVHDRVGAEVDGQVQLLQLPFDVRRNGGVADVGVDLDAGGLADADGLQPRVVDVGRDDHAARRDLLSHGLRLQPLALRDGAHLRRDGAPPGVVHLGVRIAVSPPWADSASHLCLPSGARSR